MNFIVVSASYGEDRPTFSGVGPFVLLVGRKQAALSGVVIGAQCSLEVASESPLRVSGVSRTGHYFTGAAWVLLRVLAQDGELQAAGTSVKLVYTPTQTTIAEVTAERDRLRATLAAETGQTGLNGWRWVPPWDGGAGGWYRGPARVVRGIAGWDWCCAGGPRGAAATALEAMEAAEGVGCL
jgi:hypothetical protein